MRPSGKPARVEYGIATGPFALHGDRVVEVR